MNLNFLNAKNSNKLVGKAAEAAAILSAIALLGSGCTDNNASADYASEISPPSVTEPDRSSHNESLPTIEAIDPDEVFTYYYDGANKKYIVDFKAPSVVVNSLRVPTDIFIIERNQKDERESWGFVEIKNIKNLEIPLLEDEVDPDLGERLNNQLWMVDLMCEDMESLSTGRAGLVSVYGSVKNVTVHQGAALSVPVLACGPEVVDFSQCSLTAPFGAVIYPSVNKEQAMPFIKGEYKPVSDKPLTIKLGEMNPDGTPVKDIKFLVVNGYDEIYFQYDDNTKIPAAEFYNSLPQSYKDYLLDYDESETPSIQMAMPWEDAHNREELLLSTLQNTYLGQRGASSGESALNQTSIDRDRDDINELINNPLYKYIEKNYEGTYKTDKYAISMGVGAFSLSLNMTKPTNEAEQKLSDSYKNEAIKTIESWGFKMSDYSDYEIYTNYIGKIGNSFTAPDQITEF